MTSRNCDIVIFPGIRVMSGEQQRVVVTVEGEGLAQLCQVAASLGGISLNNAADRMFRAGLKAWKPLEPPGPGDAA